MSPPLTPLLLMALSQAPDQVGPYSIDSELGTSSMLASGVVVTDLYWPIDAAGDRPVVVVGHGFARSSEVMAGWGAHLASYGFVVAVPNFPSPLSPDHVLNAALMRELIDQVRLQPPAGITIDGFRSALVGHSAGGLSVFLAAAQLADLTAAVGLDPVDNQGQGAAVGPTVGAPVLVLAAEPAQCNAQGSAAALYPTLTSPGSWYLRVVSSTHCDGEDPSSFTCTAFCGGEDPVRRDLYRRYATAHLLASFACEALDFLPGGAGLQADLGAGTVSDLAQVGSLCAGSMDGGVDAGAPPTADAESGTDARSDDRGGEEHDAAEDADAGGEVSDAGASAKDAGSVDATPIDSEDPGCACSASRSSSSPRMNGALLVFLTGLLFAPFCRERCRS